ncbi:hypothetical protein [Holospora undulata]|uniref:hypothetical protein n=1 Tax=Holospora undulata TaxID=1169117 RepID=UPI00032EB2D6
MNVRSALKAVSFEGGSGTNVKNMEKISRGVHEKDKLSLRFIRKRPFNEPNCSAFWCQHHSCFEEGGHLIIKAMRQN